MGVADKICSIFYNRGCFFLKAEHEPKADSEAGEAAAGSAAPSQSELAAAWALLLFSHSLLLWFSGNVVARDAGNGPDALVVSGDSHLLAFVGPSKYVVTVMEACSLDEVPSGLPAFLEEGGEGGEHMSQGTFPLSVSDEIDQGPWAPAVLEKVLSCTAGACSRCLQ